MSASRRRREQRPRRRHRRAAAPATTAAPATAAPARAAAPVEIPDLSAYTIGLRPGRCRERLEDCQHEVDPGVRAEAAGTDLLFTDAQGKQEAQVESIRGFIEQGVDLIAFSPIVETGWDAVLVEARDAGIPVILTDRAIDSQETDLYKTFLGSDFILEGEKAGDWVNEEFADADSVNIVELQGTTGSAPALDRAEGFRNVVTDPKFEFVASQTGDFTREGGKKVMEAFLQANPEIDLVYAHNDDMGLGAIEAIEAAGLVPGNGHQDRHDRCGPRRDAGARRRQDQLHRRVLAAARATADAAGGRGARRRGSARPES